MMWVTKQDPVGALLPWELYRKCESEKKNNDDGSESEEEEEHPSAISGADSSTLPPCLVPRGTWVFYHPDSVLYRPDSAHSVGALAHSVANPRLLILPKGLTGTTDYRLQTTSYMLCYRLHTTVCFL